ncbi:MAG: hypothetical protein K2G86_00910, partial [Prevotella sp.]|nr:hypothetical protein [Prevotella sp.]
CRRLVKRVGCRWRGWRQDEMTTILRGRAIIVGLWQEAKRAYLCFIKKKKRFLRNFGDYCVNLQPIRNHGPKH